MELKIAKIERILQVRDPNYSHEIVTPLKGAKIREVKIYERL